MGTSILMLKLTTKAGKEDLGSFNPPSKQQLHRYAVALCPGSLICSTYMRKEGVGGLGCNVTDASMTSWKRDGQQPSISNRSTNLVYQTQLFEAFRDPITLTWRLWHHIFYPRRTGVLENMACPRTISTICHPSYPSIWAYVMHVTLHPRFPLFVCTLKRLGSLGTRLGMLHKIQHPSILVIKP